jgi:hypothetical protein
MVYSPVRITAGLRDVPFFFNQLSQLVNMNFVLVKHIAPVPARVSENENDCLSGAQITATKALLVDRRLPTGLALFVVRNTHLAAQSSNMACVIVQRVLAIRDFGINRANPKRCKTQMTPINLDIRTLLT